MERNDSTFNRDATGESAGFGRIEQLTSILLATLFLGAGVSGCDQDGPMEEAAEEMEDVMDDAGDELEDAADEVEDEIQ